MGNFRGLEDPMAGYSPWGRRVGHDLGTEHIQTHVSFQENYVLTIGSIQTVFPKASTTFASCSFPIIL